MEQNPENGQQVGVAIDTNFLVSLHQDLGTLMLVFQGGGLPETIRVDDLKAVNETCEILEKLVAFIKKRERENKNKDGQNTPLR